jgi:hypothetical protein
MTLTHRRDGRHGLDLGRSDRDQAPIVDPHHDLDMTATSLVKTYARGHGSTYPDMAWEPKQAFGAVASFYAAR